MSKNVSNNFKNIIKAGGPFYSYVIMKLSNGTEITLTSENDFTISGTGYSEGENSGFPLGSALSKTVTLNLDNTTMTGALQDVDSDNILDTQNDEIITQENSLGNDYYYARFTLYTEADLPDGTTERIQEGVFTVIDSVAPGDVLEITGNDDMYKADTEFVSTLTYPVSAQQLLNEVCSKCDITLGSASFKNNNYQIQQAPEGLTGRQVIGYIAQIACGNAVINPSGQLIIKSYDFSDFVDEDVIAGEIETASGIHILSDYINDPNISTDDVTITGVSTTIESDDSDEDETYLVGSEYYAIKIDNPLIVGNEKTAIDLIADSIIGITMRPFSGTFMPDPTIEFMDLCYVLEKRDAAYKSFITSHDFDYIGSSNVSCGVESPERYSGTYYSNASEVYQKAKKQIQNNKTQWEQAIENLSQQVANASGLYTTEETQPDGSTIFYMHNKPTLEESDIVWKMTAETLTVSTDGGKTWNAGITVNGQVIAQIMSTIGLNFDWGVGGTLIIQDASGNQTAYIDAETGTVRLSVEELKIVGKTVEEIANEESETVLNDFVGSVYTPTITNLQNQIDGQIETWFYNYIPTAENYPASEWTTDTEKDKHLGDLFYVVDNTEYGGQAYRWAKIGTDYLWDYVEDTAVVKALADAAAAQDTADQKRRVFVTTPYPPYDIGDLWVGDDTSEMMRCQVSRQSGNYVSTDWIKAVKYTDDTELYNFIQNDYADTIQEIYNSVDQKSETWYQPEDPSLNWTDTESVSLADVSGDSIIDVSGEEILAIFESEKFKHEGDLWKDSDTNIEYIYKGGTWVEMPIPDAVFDEIDGKAQIFVVQPTPPYNIGDTWFTGTTILVCNTARNSGDFVSSDWTKKDNYTDDSALYEFIEGDYSETIEELKTQTDGKAETWYQATDPAASWSDDEKAEHAGDLWYNTADQKTYIYNGSSWDETKSTPPDEVFDEIDGKAQIFISTPVPPYAAGDLWFNSATSDIMTCISSRNIGEYNVSDWQKRNKYTDDSYAQEVNAALNNFISDYSEEISDIQNQIDKKAETWYQESDPAAQWTEKTSDALCDLSGESIQDSTDSEIITIWESEKSMHDGDLWHVPSTGKEYIYVDGTWQEMDIPDDVFDLIDGKAQIFVTQPVPPYSIGDLWFNSDTSDIMTCINSRDNGSYNEGDWQKRNKYTDDTYAEQVENNLNNFSEAVTEDMDNLQTQIDGKIETWYYEHEPTLENEPASGWTTDAEKQKHIGDLFYRQSNGHSYRFMKTGEDEFEWTLIQDSDIQNALTTANNAQDTADNKRRVFVTTPVPPYDIGDLWVQGANGDIMRCATARVSGDYNSEDWEKASKYTDDTAVNELDESLNQQEVFDRLTNGGAAQGIYIKDGNIFVNASYIQSGTMSADRIYGGTLSLGGIDNSGGVFNLYDENGTLKSVMDNDGFNFWDGENFVGSIRTRYMEEYERGCCAICADNVSVIALSSNYIFDNDPDSKVFNSDIYMTNTGFFVGDQYKLPGVHFPRYVYFENDIQIGQHGRISEDALTSNRLLHISVSTGDDIWIGANSNEFGDTEVRIYGDLQQMRDPSNPSDERLKTKITPFSESAINIINDIQIYGYTWIESGKSEKAGFIAQQLESDVSADLTRIGKDGVHNVKPTKMIPYLVKAVQELSEEIELLKKEICDLKGENYTPKEHKKDKWKPSDMPLEEKREFIKSLRRAEMKK